MFNYNNLSDFDFEVLCKYIMEKKLGKNLYVFAPGRDGGVDITEDCIEKSIVIQVKHYCNSPFSGLKSSLKKEVEKVVAINPKQYYICCAQRLSLNNVKELYEMFSEYMESKENILDLRNIDEYLKQEENKDILRANYKLWLESANILSELHNQSIFVDCEVLLYGIEAEKNKFVETNYYQQCKDILEKEGAVLLIGTPGVGKTITTKMLALYYAANGYKIRYTTNGDITKLKDALSMNREEKELVLLDDCLGQHYFNMKSTQGNELLALVKYILLNPNKKIILNSRVTIFNQALEETRDFKYFINSERIKLRVLDVNEIGIVDKGRIFYNHIYFENLPKAYFDNLKDKLNYKKIVKHPNYTPRLMEFVTQQWNYEQVVPMKYTSFILRVLNNPKEIWQDEFTQRLKAEDRILMTTLYSLTDTEVSIDVLQRAYNYRLQGTPGVDTTRNLFEESMNRLTKSMIKVIDKYNRKMVGVMNPSINDFLKKYLEENINEKENIRKNMTEYTQIKRNFPNDMIEIIKKGEANQYNYQRGGQRSSVIISYICTNELLLEECEEVVENFFQEDIYDFDESIISRMEALMKLLRSPLDKFYNTFDLCNRYGLTKLFGEMELGEFGIFIKEINRHQTTWILEEYVDEIVEGMNREIKVQCQEVDGSAYYGDYDIDEIIDDNVSEKGEIDFSNIINTICTFIIQNLEEDIWDVISKFPKMISSRVKLDVGSSGLDISDIKQVVENYIHEKGREEKVNTKNDDEELLELIFHREMS